MGSVLVSAPRPTPVASGLWCDAVDPVMSVTSVVLPQVPPVPVVSPYRSPCRPCTSLSRTLVLALSRKGARGRRVGPGLVIQVSVSAPRSPFLRDVIDRSRVLLCEGG